MLTQTNRANQQKEKIKMEFLTEIQIAWLPALLQLIAYVFILFALAVTFWWGSIVITDLYKRLKTGVRRWTTQ